MSDEGKVCPECKQNVAPGAEKKHALSHWDATKPDFSRTASPEAKKRYAELTGEEVR